MTAREKYDALLAKFRLVEADNFDLSARILKRKASSAALRQERFLLLSELAKFTPIGETSEGDPLAELKAARK